MECVVGAHCQLQPTNIVDMEWVGSKIVSVYVVFIIWITYTIAITCSKLICSVLMYLY